MFGGDAARIKKAGDAQNDAGRLELSIIAADAEYCRIREINKLVRALLSGLGPCTSCRAVVKGQDG